MTIDPRSRPLPRPKEHGPYIGARNIGPLAVALWLVLVIGILWRVYGR